MILYLIFCFICLPLAGE